MAAPVPTPLEIYKILPQTNCGKCILPSCLAFAAAVAAGGRKLKECPDIDPKLLTGFSGQIRATDGERDLEQAAFIDKLKRKMAGIDPGRIAPVIGARRDGDSLIINSLGKNFQVDHRGEMVSECHIIPWVVAPLLSYISNPTHAEPTGEWISFREIKGGIEWQGLFTRRCENVLKELADANPDLLTDLIDIFNGREVDWYEADIALVLHPLPHIPILICYQGREDDLDSGLTIFLDRCCGTNLHIKPLFTLCSGLVQMFAKIATRHR